MHITYGTIEQSRLAIIDHINSARSINPNYRVIDLGGVAGGSWSSPYIDMCVDICADTSITALSIDLCRPETWAPLWADIEANGQYDFAICNHTLEDLYNPFPVLDNLGKIARRGMITTPSISTELAHLPESPEWRGYYHHRWIFEQVDGKMLAIPKLGLIERADNWPDVYIPVLQEIRYEWIGSVEYQEFGNNYLAGPDPYKEVLVSTWEAFKARFSSS